MGEGGVHRGVDGGVGGRVEGISCGGMGGRAAIHRGRLGDGE